MIVYFVGDTTNDVRLAAQAQDSTATLLTQQNYNNVLPGTYYISLGDFDNLQSFVDALNQASTLIYVPPQKWSDTKKDFSYMQHWTEFYLGFFKDKKSVQMHNINKSITTVVGNWLALADTRQSQSPQLWIVGCSTTHGDGVTQEQRYGQLIADQLAMPASFLTQPGSSISWAADQIIRSDLRAGDTVIWGITQVCRFTYCHNDAIKHVTYQAYQKDPGFDKIVALDQLSNKNVYYQGVTAIHRVVNFCKKLNVKLYLGGILVDPPFLPYLDGLPNYTQLFGHVAGDHHHEFFDIGSDGEHPGPLTHRYYAKTLLDKITHE